MRSEWKFRTSHSMLADPIQLQAAHNAPVCAPHLQGSTELYRIPRWITRTKGNFTLQAKASPGRELGDKPFHALAHELQVY